MNLLVERLKKTSKLKEIHEHIKKYQGLIKVNVNGGSFKSFLTSSIYELEGKNILYISSNELEAKKKYEELIKINGEDKVFLFPSKDIFFYSSEAKSHDVMKDRMKVINKLSSVKKDEKLIIVMSAEALLDKVTPKSLIDDFTIHVNMSSSFDIKIFEKNLMYMGYEKVNEITLQGEYSVRGGIIDIFPISFDNPIRIELWGEDVDSIRIFDVENQKSIEKIDEITIMPAKDILFNEEKIDEARQQITYFRKKDLENSNIYDYVYETLENANAIYYPEKYLNLMFEKDELVSILEYINFEEDVIIIDELRKLEQKCNIEEELFFEYLKEEMSKGKLINKQADLRFTFEDIKYELENYKLINLSIFDTEGYIEPKVKFKFDVQNVDIAIRNINAFKEELESVIKEDYIPIVLTSTNMALNNIKAELLTSDFNVKVIDINSKEDNKFEEKVIYLSIGSFENGFISNEMNMVIFAADELLKGKRKNIKRKAKGKAIESFTDLKVGDFIVHEDHGIGIYEGIENVQTLDISKDYLKIAYADKAKLYVAIENLNLVQKYIGNEDKPPKINKLNGTEWVKAKTKAKESVREIAEKLVKLYAKRASIKGHECMPDNEWQREFEDEFPYVETNDQLLAIEDVKNDMESSKVMDRLLCGDVGFGKTEVAIRAAFKAVQDGMQVALLAPTTILVEQHYKTFKERMKNFPVEIEYVSRFRTTKEVNNAFNGTKKGTVDIIIGTHKLLSEKVEFKNLGLVILDEEQRFGVEQKELLKSKTENVDTLAMSATPIPRTLHMSLSGIRDISILEEPPKERKPVQTYVIERNEGLIKNAIYKEVARGGQVFYLYNRVKGISKLTNELREMMPDIRFEYAHGTMRKSEMEEVMREFVNGNIDVLVSTTIIETGIDIPNVNTMIIEDADKMGLSQLYQLKGRVGRQSRSAYCYFTYTEGKVLSEVADKRLAALKEFTELGAGLKVAMRDLEIRGAGNLLGSEQHGHLASVGYDMYCKLLEDAILEEKGEEVTRRSEVKIELNINAYIDEEYISDSFTKVEIYKRIAAIETNEELEELIDELTDRFGDVPRYTANVLYIALLKSLVRKINIKSVIENDEKIIFTFEDEKNLKAGYVTSLMNIANSESDKIRIAFGTETRMYYKKSKEENTKDRILINNLIDLLNSIVNSNENLEDEISNKLNENDMINENKLKKDKDFKVKINIKEEGDKLSEKGSEGIKRRIKKRRI